MYRSSIVATLRSSKGILLIHIIKHTKNNMDLQSAAQERLAAIIEDGTVNAIIEKQLTATVASIVKDIFQDYSEFGKQLKKTLSEKMAINMDELKVDQYSALVMQSIESILVGTALESSLGNIRDHVKRIVDVLEKKNWKLSEIINKFMEENSYSDNDATYSAEEPSNGSYWLRIGEKKDSESRYSTGRSGYKISLLVDEKTGVVHNVWYESKPLNILKVDTAYKFEAFLIQLWVSQCIIEVDDDDADYACMRHKD